MPGQYLDLETGFHYNYYRDYAPDLGRYLTPDPIGIDGGLNVYGYVGDDPVNWVDPLGLNPLILAGVVAAGAIDAGTLGALTGIIGGGLIGYAIPIPNWMPSENNNDDPVVYPDNPDKAEGKFEPMRGRPGKECNDGSVWERDKSGHGGPQWKRWPSKKAYENKEKPTSVWPDGRIRK